jgi:uncharacterized protein (TIGR03067 family)
MRHSVLFAINIVFVTIHGSPFSGRGTDEIEGRWKITKFQLGGKLIPEEAKELLESFRVEFKDGKISLKIGDQQKEGTYKIDSSIDPKHIDLTFGDETVRGIYELIDNKLRIRGAEKDKDRPMDFSGRDAVIIELKAESDR